MQYKSLIHYGDASYSELELKVLVAINFDLKIDSIFRPIESLLHEIHETCRDKDKIFELHMKEALLSVK